MWSSLSRRQRQLLRHFPRVLRPRPLLHDKGNTRLTHRRFSNSPSLNSANSTSDPDITCGMPPQFPCSSTPLTTLSTVCLPACASLSSPHRTHVPRRPVQESRVRQARHEIDVGFSMEAEDQAPPSSEQTARWVQPSPPSFFTRTLGTLTSLSPPLAASLFAPSVYWSRR